MIVPAPEVDALVREVMLPTHRIRLCHRDGRVTTRDVVLGHGDLPELSGRGVVSGHAVILDRVRAAVDLLLEGGWTSEFVAPGQCRHPRLRAMACFERMDYRAACPDCLARWSWDDLDLPAEVRARAEPVWTRHGL